MTEGESEDTDPGGTSVLRVTCLEYVFGLKSIFAVVTRLNTLNTVERIVAQLRMGNRHITNVLEPVVVSHE